MLTQQFHQTQPDVSTEILNAPLLMITPLEKNLVGLHQELVEIAEYSLVSKKNVSSGTQDMF